MQRETVLNALSAFASQRPGLEFGNYGDLKAYRAEMRSITRDLAHARTLLRAVELRQSITAEQIIEAAKHAYSGRLVLETVRKHECESGHKWAAPVTLSEHTQNLSGEATQYCPKCNKRAAISSPHCLRIDYCTGQYWPTEYRKAVCAVLSAVLWDYWRDQCMPAPVAHCVVSWDMRESSKPLKLHAAVDLLNAKGGREYGHLNDLYRRPGATSLVSAGDYLRNTAKRELGRPIASRWFN